MNVLAKYALWNMKYNRKRTLFTMLGVLITVAVTITAACFLTSFQQFMFDNVAAEYGNWHYAILNADYCAVQKLDGTVCAISEAGFERINENDKSPKYLVIHSYNRAALSAYSVTPIEGRLPQNEGELAVEQGYLDQFGYKIGDSITINVGTRHVDGQAVTGPMALCGIEGENVDDKLHNVTERTYTIVGTISGLHEAFYPEQPGTVACGYGAVSYLNESTLNSNDKVNLYVSLSEPGKDIQSIINNLTMQLDSEGIRYDWAFLNTPLLAQLGIGAQNSLIMPGSGGTALPSMNLNTYFTAKVVILEAVVVLLVLCSGAVLIYHSFAISATVRRRQFGILSSVGATKKQLRRTALTEAAVMSMICIPAGIGIGITVLACIFPLLGKILKEGLSYQNDVMMKLTVSPIWFAAAICISILTILLSAMLPLVRLTKNAPIEIIRGNDIDLAKSVKTPRLIQKLFGINGILADKIVKQNRKEYLTVVISLSFCLIFMIATASEALYIRKAAENIRSNINFDIGLTAQGGHAGKLQEFISEVNSLDGVTQVVTKRIAVYSAVIPAEKTKTGESDTEVFARVVSLDDDAWKNYNELIGTDETDGGCIILDGALQSVSHSDRTILISRYNFKSGDTITLSDANGKQNTVLINVTTQSTTLPLGESYDVVSDEVGSTNFSSVLTLIVKESEFEMLLDQLIPQSYDTSSGRLIYLMTEDSEKTEREIANAAEKFGVTVRIDNINSEISSDQNSALVMFIYLILVLIMILCVVNMLNILSNSFLRQSKTFTMLKSIGTKQRDIFRIIALEGIQYSLKILLIALPVSLGMSVGLYLWSTRPAAWVNFGFELPILSILMICAAFVAVILSVVILTGHRTGKENVIDGLKDQEGTCN